MNVSFLKKLRVFFSIFYLLAFLILFIDFTGLIPSSIYDSFLFLQLVPSFLKLKNLLLIGGLGFFVMVALNVLFGRVYCSFICPLGILQDVFSFISKKIQGLKRYKYKYQKPFLWIRYSLLFVFIAGIASGGTIVLSILDPYSIFGRITSGLLRPLIVSINNLIASLMQKVNVYSLYHVDLKPENWAVLSLTVVLLLVVLLFSLRKGRLYCNLICPVGTFLSLLSRFSVFKITIDKNTCTSCRLCERVCKAGCIDLSAQQIDFDRCVACYNCLTICPVGSIQYKHVKVKQSIQDNSGTSSYNENRRRILSLFLLLFTIGKSKGQQKISGTATIPTKRKIAISPPGSGSIDSFNSACTACHLCVSACPTHVLQPSYTDYGLIGFMQPVMDNTAGFCNFECIKCSEVCPTGAIRLLKLEDKQLVQIGRAQFVKDNCVVVTEGTDCGACAEHCPTKAVRMVPYKNNLMIPEVTEDICIGCGACEYACPTIPYKAIYVEGNQIHVVAKKPDTTQQKVQAEEDFPF